jgi:hypothetical protein
MTRERATGWDRERASVPLIYLPRKKSVCRWFRVADRWLRMWSLLLGAFR